MRVIISYIINMLPYMLIALPVYLVARGIYIKVKKLEFNLVREVILLGFVVFIAGLTSQTVIPKFEFGADGFGIVENGVHQTNLIPFKVFSQTRYEVFVNKNINYFLINFLGNIILFMPFGFFIPLLWRISAIKAVIIGFLASLFIETCQLFLARGTDVDDLILNTFGALLGAILFKIIQRYCKGFVEKFAFEK